MGRGRRRRADEARHGGAALERAHGEGHRDVDQDVDHGRGRESLEHLEGELLHRPRSRGELHQPDGQRHRAVLDGVEELRGERRQDDAECHREEHVGVGLRQRESERERREPLATGKAQDPGADLLGDACRGVEAKRHHGGVERGVRQLLEPVAGRSRQQLRQHEVPQEHLHQQRDVAEELDIGVAEVHEPGRGCGADNTDDRPERQRQAPGGGRGRERPAGAHQQGREIGVHPVRGRLEEDPPVPVVVHATKRVGVGWVERLRDPTPTRWNGCAAGCWVS